MSAPVIVITNLKGGTGKTNMAFHLAYLMGQDVVEGEYVTIIDADPNRSAAEWHVKSGQPAGIRVVPSESVKLYADIEAARALGPVIVDTPGNQENISMKALTRATTVLYPVNAEPTDLNLQEPMLDMIRAFARNGVEWHSVLTRTNDYPKETREYREWLDEHDGHRLLADPHDPTSGIEIPRLKLYSQNFRRVPQFLRQDDMYVALYERLFPAQ